MCSYSPCRSAHSPAAHNMKEPAAQGRSSKGGSSLLSCWKGAEGGGHRGRWAVFQHAFSLPKLRDLFFHYRNAEVFLNSCNPESLPNSSPKQLCTSPQHNWLWWEVLVGGWTPASPSMGLGPMTGSSPGQKDSIYNCCLCYLRPLCYPLCTVFCFGSPAIWHWKEKSSQGE